MSQRGFLVLVLSLTIGFWGAVSQAQTPYYAGKTITIVAGTKAGDVYDLYARMFAQFMPKYIPGHPNIIVQNMAGAGSMIAANFVYNVANPDGLTIGAIFSRRSTSIRSCNVRRSNTIGTSSPGSAVPVTSNHLLYMRADSPYKTIHDVVAASTPPKCGATGTSSTAYYVPKLLDEVIGTKFDIILGYQSGQDIDLAVERNEVVCRAFTITAFFAREPFISWRKKDLRPIEMMQSGRKRDQRLEGHADDLRVDGSIQNLGGGRLGHPGVGGRRFRPSLRDAAEHSSGARENYPRGLRQNAQ